MMSKRMMALVLLGALSTFSGAPKRSVYQVISSHPHDVKEFSPYIETISEQGRLWLVHLKENTPAGIKRYFRLTDGTEAHYLVNADQLKKNSFPSSLIKDFTSRIEVAGIKADVEALANYKSRAAGSADNQKAASFIKETLASLGYSVSEQCYRQGACSIIADKAGDGSTDGVIMLMAHFDSVGKNFAGADDNASGTAVLLEVARVLKDYGNKNTIRFFATNGEELGLLGAKYYAKTLKESGEIRQLKLAINMDMVGYNSNGVVELETDKEFEGLAQWFAELASQYTDLQSKITIGAWGSDHVPFINGGVPTLLTIEDWSTKTPCYHMECDKPATLNYGYATEIAKLNLAAMMTKDRE